MPCLKVFRSYSAFTQLWWHSSFFHHLVRTLGVLNVDRLYQDRVRLRSKTDNVLDRGARALVLYLTYHLLVLLALEEVVLGVVACVVKASVLLHVSVHVLRLDIKEKAVRVRVKQLAPVAVLHLQVVVVKVIHQRFAEVQDVHARVHRLHQLDLFLVHLDSC